MGSLLADHNWSQYSRILDIGGATGSLLSEILNQHGGKGVVCDLENVRLLTDSCFILSGSDNLGDVADVLTQKTQNNCSDQVALLLLSSNSSFDLVPRTCLLNGMCLRGGLA